MRRVLMMLAARAVALRIRMVMMCRRSGWGCVAGMRGEWEINSDGRRW